MWYADTVGLKKVCDRIRQLEQQHGEIWQPAPLLEELARQGSTFEEFSKQRRARV